MTNSAPTRETKSRGLLLAVGTLGTLVLLPVLLTVLVVAWFAYDSWSSAPNAQAAQQRVVHKLSEIRIRPGDVHVDSSANYKAHHGLAGVKYKTSADYMALREYYDDELSARGWVYCGERAMRDWGEDLGGRQAFYRNGDDTVALQYAGERASYGWDYSLSVSWGLHSGCGD